MEKKPIDKLSFSDKISAFVKVKITKKEPDAKTSLCGEKVQIDKNGNEFFVIPEHQAKYISETFPNYTVSKGFLPQASLDKINSESELNESIIDTVHIGTPDLATEDNEEEETHTITISPKKQRGNPNWLNKHKAPLHDTSVTVITPEHQQVKV